MTTHRELNVRELLELERQIYQESIDLVLQQKEQLVAGTLDDYIQRCKPFEIEKEEELQLAQSQYEFSQQDAFSLFEFDMQQAHDVFQADQKQLKYKLLENVQRRRRRIEKRLKRIETTVIDTSNLNMLARQSENIDRVNKLKPKVLTNQLRRAQEQTRSHFNFRHLSSDGVLPTPEQIVENLVNECAKLQKNREYEDLLTKKEDEGVIQERKVMINADKQELSCCGSFDENGEIVEETFRIGDAVVLVSRLSEEDFHGFVSAITADEVKLVLVCGTHVRVTMARLRCGQCALRKQPERTFVSMKNPEDDCSIEEATGLDKLLRDPPDAQRHAAAVMSQLKRKTTSDSQRGFELAI